MRGMLRAFWQGVVEFLESLVDIIGHGYVNIADSIVPRDGETQVAVARPAGGDGVFFLKSFKQVNGSGFFEILDSKIIDCQGKSYGAAFVTPKFMCVGHREVTMLSQMLSELIVSKNGYLFQSIHTFANFQLKIALGIEVVVGDVVFCHYFGCDILLM